MPSFLVYISHPFSNLLSPGVLRVWYSRPMRDDEVPTSRLHVASPPQPSAHAAAPSPSDSYGEVPIPRFSHCTALVSCYGDAEVPFPRPRVSCLSCSPSPPIVRPQPALQTGGPLGNGSFRFASSAAHAPAISPADSNLEVPILRVPPSSGFV
jgi:hypothetical protein